MNPAWEKVAKHARHDLRRTLQAIFEHIERLEPMSSEEIFIRETHPQFPRGGARMSQAARVASQNTTAPWPW